MAKKIRNGYEREKNIFTHEFVTLSEHSQGREKKLEDDRIRTEFQRDSHRIYYSQPFRRLRHKTQVFYKPDNDHISTRMEHALFVSSAARTIARALKLNEDLAEAIGLGHDLGHAPFGHHGESVLNDLCTKHNIRNAFHHEVNSLRVVDRLAQLDREDCVGLYLTYEVRDGIVSHNGEKFTKAKIVPYKGKKDLDSIILREDAGHPSTLEGCIVRLSDVIAYAGRDVEDGIQAGLIDSEDIPKVITKALGDNNGAIVGNLIEDVIKSTPQNADFITLSEEKFEALKQLKDFNEKYIYNHTEVQRYRQRVKFAIETLFNIFIDTLNRTDRFQEKVKVRELTDISLFITFRDFVKDMGYTREDSNGQIVVDFISGFTDNFIIKAVNDVFVPRSIV